MSESKKMEKRIGVINLNIGVLKERLDASVLQTVQYRDIMRLNLEKADGAMEKRLDQMNEVRAQLDKQAATFVTREAMDTVKIWAELALKQAADKYEEMIKTGQTRLERLEVEKGKMEGKMWGIGLIWTIVLIFMSWYLNTHMSIGK